MRIGSRHHAASTLDWLKRLRLLTAVHVRPWRGDCANARTGATPGASCAWPGVGVLAPWMAARYPDTILTCVLEDLGEVSVVSVGDGGDKSLARSMMATWHSEGEARCPGARMSYWIMSSRHGRLGGLVFSAASWHQKARDGFIGWSRPMTPILARSSMMIVALYCHRSGSRVLLPVPRHWPWSGLPRIGTGSMA